MTAVVGAFEGRAFRYDEFGQGGVVFARGCFDGILARGDGAPLCWMHDEAEVVGQVLDIEAGPSGPLVRAVVTDECTWKLIRSGRFAALSVTGFLDTREPTDEERDRHWGVKSVVTNVRHLVEVSVVPWGKQPGARVLRVADPAPADLVERFTAARRRAAAEVAEAAAIARERADSRRLLASVLDELEEIAA